MKEIEEELAGFLAEGLEDYIGLWQLKNEVRAGSNIQEAVLMLASKMLESGWFEVGALVATGTNFGKNRHERQGEGTLSEQAAHEIRDLEGEKKSIGFAADAEIARKNNVANKSQDARNDGRGADRDGGFQQFQVLCSCDRPVLQVSPTIFQFIFY